MMAPKEPLPMYQLLVAMDMMERSGVQSGFPVQWWKWFMMSKYLHCNVCSFIHIEEIVDIV